jgi:hypothetical protein
MKTADAREFESADQLSSAQDQGSTGPVVAMVGCMLSLLMMLFA